MFPLDAQISNHGCKNCDKVTHVIFNKEAYLDLSKPYQQNNPQSAKQDNQASKIWDFVMFDMMSMGSCKKINENYIIILLYIKFFILF
jgi:hypothetical protein